MAEDSGQEKTEEPTSKRLADARKKGQIPRSRELNTAVVLITGSLTVWLLGSYFGQRLLTMMRKAFSIEREVIFSPNGVATQFEAALWDMLTLLAPFLAIMLCAALLAPILLGGWAVSWESVAPKLNKLDPIQGLARMFSLRSLVELLKSLLKFSLIFLVSWLLYWVFIDEFLRLSGMPLDVALSRSLSLIGLCFFLLSVSLLVIAAIDVPYQLWDHQRKLKMSLQEIKDEMKETEGSPEIKARIRRVQMEMAQRRMMEQVPKADVVVTNPDHYAVALRYDPNQSGAPRVVAKGTDALAARIRRAALDAGIPLLAAPPLARALYYSTPLDREIPQGLYLAVAQVLVYVYQLKSARNQGWQAPQPPTDWPIPDDLRHD